MTMSTPLEALKNLCEENGDYNDCIKAIEAIKNMNEMDQQGRTPLHMVCFHKNKKTALEMMNLLLEKGAKPNTQDKEGWTALCLATKNGAIDLVDKLIPMTNIELPTEEGCTALSIAIIGKHLKIATLLLKAKADPNSYSKTGCTPCHYAANTGSKEILEELLKKGGKIQVSNHKKYTPLHLAAKEGHVEMVKYLLEMNASPWSKNEAEETALQLSQKYNHNEIVSVLKQAMELNEQIEKTDQISKEKLEFLLGPKPQKVNRIRSNNELKYYLKDLELFKTPSPIPLLFSPKKATERCCSPLCEITCVIL